MKSDDRLYSILGLAQKAGSLRLGQFTMERYLENQKAYLLLVAQDAGSSTKKRMMELSKRFKVPLIEWGAKDEFAKIFNRLVAAILVTKEDFVRPFYQEGGNLKS